MEQHTQAPVVGIIGAGLAGLVAAYETHKLLPQATIKIYEAEDRIGGKLRTVAFEHGPVDMGAEAYLAKAQHATDFFTELGLADRLREPSGMPSMLYLPDGNGELKPLPRGTLMGIPAAAESVAHLVDEATPSPGKHPQASPKQTHPWPTSSAKSTETKSSNASSNHCSAESTHQAQN